MSPDIFWWGGGLPREGVGAKKFGMSLETQGIKLFWRDVPGFCRDIPEAPEKFEKKMFGFNSRPQLKRQGSRKGSFEGSIESFHLSSSEGEIYVEPLTRSFFYDSDQPGCLVGACLATGDRILATGSDSVSKTVL